MGYQFINSLCMCGGILRRFDRISVIDSDKLVGNFEVLSLIIDGETYEINTIFTGDNGKGDFIDYLNETFRIIYGLAGNFDETGDFIDYENIEEFETIEVVAILEYKYKTVSIVGGQAFVDGVLDASIIITNDYIQDPDLIDQVLDPRIVSNNQLRQLVYETSFDNSNGRITMPVYNLDVICYGYKNVLP